MCCGSLQHAPKGAFMCPKHAHCHSCGTHVLEVVLVLGMDNLTVSLSALDQDVQVGIACKVLADMQSKGQVQCQILCYLCLIWVSLSF